jgi:hypothetical protein
MKKTHIIIVMFIASLFLTSCTQQAREEAFWADHSYANTFRLFSSDENGGSIDSLQAKFPTIKKILWLEKLPEDIPDDTLAYYPSRYTKINLDNINGIVQDKKIDVSEFGLTYPVTMQDILNKHEAMLKLIGSFDDEDTYRFRYAEPEEAQEWRRTTMYAYTYGIKNNRDVKNFNGGVSVDYDLYREILWLEELPAEVEDDVMVFYSTEKTAVLADNLTQVAKADGLDLAAYGLSDPITVQDMLTKHDAIEKVRSDLSETNVVLDSWLLDQE